MNNLPYYLSIIIMSIGLFMLINSDNYLKKILSLGLFQNAILFFYIAIGKVDNGVVPLNHATTNGTIFTNPIPHVLMLTAIVVGFTTMALALSFIYQCKKHFNSISEQEITENI